VLVELLTGVDGSGLDGAKEELSHTWLLDVDEVGLEHALRSFESFRADFDDSAVGELWIGKRKGGTSVSARSGN
jgi:hypothetical protein